MRNVKNVVGIAAAVLLALLVLGAVALGVWLVAWHNGPR
jgi:hypothetical protein